MPFLTFPLTPLKQNPSIAAGERPGYRMVQPENEGYVIYLPPDATDDALGQALLKALDKSQIHLAGR
jgi:hypothetical protein